MWRIQFFSQSRKGSPPHTWRILAPQCIPLSAVRITSTLVENTLNRSSRYYRQRDHLHTRGEYDFDRQKMVPKPGSPPHSWRILAKLWRKPWAVRITSTLVENTLWCRCFWQWEQDHLHTRGEYTNAERLDEFNKGSPPHSWRILQPLSISSKIDRITSTLVENTFSFAEHNLLGEDHLHTRGEYSHLQLRQLNQSGSPPHSWRIPTMHSSSLIPYRITSTLVENTLNDPRYINISQSK